MKICPQVQRNGDPIRRLPTTTNLSFPAIEADSLLVNLDLQDIAVSSGAACSSGTLKVSPVLAAMGISPSLAKGSIRFSLGRASTDQEIDYVLGVLPEIVQRLQENRDK